MVPEFGAAVAKLEKGKFTLEPVKTQFGYHVILLEDTRAKSVPSLRANQTTTDREGARPQHQETGR